MPSITRGLGSKYKWIESEREREKESERKRASERERERETAREISHALHNTRVEREREQA